MSFTEKNLKRWSYKIRERNSRLTDLRRFGGYDQTWFCREPKDAFSCLAHFWSEVSMYTRLPILNCESLDEQQLFDLDERMKLRNTFELDLEEDMQENYIMQAEDGLTMILFGQGTQNYYYYGWYTDQ